MTSIATATATNGKYVVTNNAGGITVDIDIDGRKQQIGSSWLVNNDSNDQGKTDVERICDTVIGTLFSVTTFSSCAENADQFTGKSYEEDEICRNFRTSFISGSLSMLSYPYNTVTYHISSNWLMKCLNIYYRVSKDYIPNNLHTFPRKMKFPRSTGINCDTIIFPNGQMRIHTSNSLKDTSPRFYIRGNFYPDGGDIEDENKYSPDCPIWMFKDRPVDEIAKMNNFSEMNITFNDIFTDGELAEAVNDGDLVKRDVMLYFNNLHHEWVTETLLPVIETTKNIKITIV